MSDAAEHRRWSAGTLTYTLGGILLLFFLLLTGDFIWSMRERSTTMISLLLIKELGASDFLNSLIIYALPCAISVVICPLISYRSDRHRGRFGRRIPYLFITTPIVFVGLMGMTMVKMFWVCSSCIRSSSGTTTPQSLVSEWAFSRYPVTRLAVLSI